MSSESPAPGPRRFVFITPVWGDAYVDRFLKLSLPTQLSDGNLGAVPRDAALYLIYTMRKYARTIARSPAYRRLKAMVPASIRLLDDLPAPDGGGDTHALQTAAYTRGMAAAGPDDACVFLTPDLIPSDGSYRNLVRLAREGKRVVLVLGLRMTTGGATTCIARHAAAGSPAVPIPPRALVRACLDNLHPISAAHIVTRGQVYAPQHFYWRVGDHGLLARGYHLHPLMVWPRDPSATIRNTLDDEYIAHSCPDRSEWHTVTDSDEICVIEFSEARHKAGMVSPQPFGDLDHLRFMAESTTPAHRLHVLKRIGFHTDGLAAPAWQDAAARSDKLVDGYLAAFQETFPDAPTQVGVGGDPVGDIRDRLAVALGRKARAGGAVPLSIPRLILVGFAAPFWVFYRLLHYKMYRYLDRLNAELIELRNLVIDTRDKLTTASLHVDSVRNLIASLETRIEALEGKGREQTGWRNQPAKRPTGKAG